MEGYYGVDHGCRGHILFDLEYEPIALAEINSGVEQTAKDNVDTLPRPKKPPKEETV